MNKVRIVRDFALLDKGAEAKNPFVIVEGVHVDDNGHLVEQDLGNRVMSTTAVAEGAIRINESDCVDIGNHFEIINDQLIAYNGGDIYEPYDVETAKKLVKDYPPEEKARALSYISHRADRYNFLLKHGMIEPVIGDTTVRAKLDTDKPQKLSFTAELAAFLGL